MTRALTVRIGARPWRSRLVGIAAGGAGLLLVLAGSARATWPTAALPRTCPRRRRARLQEVTEHVSVSARSSGDAFRLRRDLFSTCSDHPELAAHIIQALKVNRYRIWREPDGLWLDDRAGALVQFQIVYAAPGSRVFFMQGRYQPAVSACDLRARRGRARVHRRACGRGQEPHHPARWRASFGSTTSCSGCSRGCSRPSSPRARRG